MSLLSRIVGESDTLPEELTISLGIADEHMISPAVTPAVVTESESQDSQKSVSAKAEQSESVDGHPSKPPTVLEVPRRTSSGLLSFLNGYPNPLSRLSAQLPLSHALPSSGSTGSENKESPGNEVGDSKTAVGQRTNTWRGRRYPISTIIIIALISFLIGSLLRSLLSPADFIYVVTDLEEGGETTKGWREIKRLVEVKYLLGGWDFQIAVVRRH